MVSRVCLCAPVSVSDCVLMPSDSHANDLREAAVLRTNVSPAPHTLSALKAIYIVKSNYSSSMREHLISIEQNILLREKRGLDEGGLLSRGISLYTIQHSLFNYFPT